MIFALYRNDYRCRNGQGSNFSIYSTNIQSEPQQKYRLRTISNIKLLEGSGGGGGGGGGVCVCGVNMAHATSL